MAMMASSTSRPRARTMAPSEIRSKSRWVSIMITIRQARVNGTAAATMMPTRQPRLIRLTAITTARATKNFTMNSSNASTM